MTVSALSVVFEGQRLIMKRDVEAEVMVKRMRLKDRRAIGSD